MNYLLTLDVGTTSVKTCLYDKKLHLVGYANDEYELVTEANNIIELFPEKYWEAARTGIKKALNTSGISGRSVRAITITTQGETLIPVDHEGRALRNAIVWLDGRAAEEGGYISEKYPPEWVYAVTGLPEINGACPISKLLWIKNHEPHIYRNTFKFMLLEDYLIMKLTGKFVTEKSLLSSTGYFDIVNDCLWQEILDYTGIEKDKFPAVMECGEKVGYIKPDVAFELGIGTDTVVVTGAMDQTAAAVGAGNTKPGIITETTGTALVIAATTQRPDFNHPSRVTIYRHAIRGKYLVIPICMTAGMVLKWFKDEFCQAETQKSRKEGRSVYALLDGTADGVPPLSNGLVLLPYFTGVITPDNNPFAKGVFFGVGLDTKKPHFIRSILEAVGYMLRENIELIEDMGISVEQIRSLGGGSQSNLWLKIKADINGKEIVNMQQSECASLGAAILGGSATGMFDDMDKAAETANGIKDCFTPQESSFKAYQEGYLRYRELYRLVKPMFS